MEAEPAGASQAWRSQRRRNLIQHTSQVLVNVPIAETEHAAILLLFKPARSFGIVVALIGVRIAVDLHDELGLRTVEVDDETAHRVLAAKPKAPHLPVTQLPP